MQPIDFPYLIMAWGLLSAVADAALMPAGGFMDHLFAQILLMFVLGYAVSFGFAVLFQSLTEPETLARIGELNDGQRVAMVGVLLAAGPVVLIRETTRARMADEWPPAIVLAGYGLSFIWGLAIGFCLIQLAPI